MPSIIIRTRKTTHMEKLTNPIKSFTLCLGVITLLTLTSNSFAQRKKKVVREPPKVSSTTSKDGRFFTINYSLKKYKDGEISYINSTKVYHITSRKYISKINYYLPTHPEFIVFSPDNKKLVTKSKSNFYLIDIKTRKPEKKFDKSTALGFYQGSDYVVVATKDSVLAFKTESMKEIRGFRFPSKYPNIQSLEESEDGKLLIGKGQKQCFIWDITSRKLLKTFNAVDIRISPDKKHIYTISYRSRLCYLDIYDATTYQIIKKTNSNIYKHFSTYAFTDASSFSPNGKYILFCAKRHGETKGLGVFDIETDSKILDIDSTLLQINFSDIKQPYQWHEESSLFVWTKGEKGGKSFEINGNRIDYQFKHKFLEKRISPNGRYISSFSSHKSSNLITVGLNTEKHSPIYLDGAQFVSFSPNSNYLFIENKDRSHGFILTKDILPNKQPKVYKFSTVPFIPGTEDEIKEDTKAPDSYQHTYISKFKHISELPDSTELKLHFKTVEVNGDTVGIQAHLIDSEGVYYYGASTEEFKRYWCGIQTKSSTELSQPTEPAYTISEVNEQDTIPIAVTFIMDHSGSMGDERALVVQEAVENLIKDKRPQDTLAILKYDSKIGIESNLSADKALLLYRLKKDGLGHYGGGTALIDAAAEGVEILKKAESFENKAIVIFTDGKENSSVLTKNELILDALSEDVKIYTIAFGSETDVEYLKDLAEATDGGYYQIYETLNFLKIFDDVYQRMRNYYTITFKADTIGKQEVTVKLCLPNGPDSLNISFENDTLVLDDVIEELTADRYSDFDEEPAEGDIKLLNVNFHFAKTDVTESSYTEIDKAVAYLKKYPSVYIELRGHTDNIGNAHANMKLSNHRAHKIKHLLTKSGIAAHRIKAIGLGESQPIATNQTEEGRALNRRTEFVVIVAN